MSPERKRIIQKTLANIAAPVLALSAVFAAVQAYEWWKTLPVRCVVTTDAGISTITLPKGDKWTGVQNINLNPGIGTARFVHNDPRCPATSFNITYQRSINSGLIMQGSFTQDAYNPTTWTAASFNMDLSARHNVGIVFSEDRVVGVTVDAKDAQIFQSTD